MTSVKVIDNFIDVKTIKYIKNMLLSELFPWFFCENIISSVDNGRSQFVHLFYKNGEPSSLFYKSLIETELVSKLSMAALVKIKANLQIKTKTLEKNHLHIDHNFPNALTAIYYVNDNDGYTFFETGERVESKEGRVVIFPSYIKHSGTTCTNKKYRCILNFNYYPQYNNEFT